jgi:thioredoxin reductase (NADPH)
VARAIRPTSPATNPPPVLFIGAQPNSDWLAGALKLDAKGFVLTGAEAGASRQLLETSRQGVFGIGDVRAGSIKRVAAAVGEGAQVVAMLHAYLAGRGSGRLSNDRTLPCGLRRWAEVWLGAAPRRQAAHQDLCPRI